MQVGCLASLMRRVTVGLPVIMLCLVMISVSAFAYKFGAFPKKGSEQVWRQANDHLNAGLHLARVGKYDQAMPEIENAIRLYPYDASYYYNLALCYESRNKSGDMAQAERLYRQSIKLEPAVWESWNGLATPLADMHRYSEAKIAKETAIKVGAPPRDAAEIKADIERLNVKIRSMSSGR